MRQGKLDPNWIETNIDKLSEEDRRYFYRALDSEQVQFHDRMVYADLRQQAMTGDVSEAAREALKRNQISQGQCPPDRDWET